MRCASRESSPTRCCLPTAARSSNQDVRRSSSTIQEKIERGHFCRRFCRVRLHLSAWIALCKTRKKESDPMKRYSIFSLVGNALSGHQNWPLAWRNPSPKKSYDVVIIGGGGHGLATAYYLAKEHGLRNVAVLEKGWLGGGNTGRNTTIVRSNYHLDPNAHFYDLSLKLWERLSQALNFNVMYSARGVLNLVHTPAEIDAAMRRGNAMRLNGIDAQFLSREEIATRIPNLDCSPNARFPIVGGLLQPRGGTVRHDAVAWGYARAADSLGVDIIQRCEVTGIRIERKAVSGVQTTLGDIGTSK